MSSVCLLVGLVLSATAPEAGAVELLAPGRHVIRLTVAGHERQYTVHVPRAYDAQQAAPLVLTLHGGGGTASSMLVMNGWADKAEAENFIAAAPEGLPARPKEPASFAGNPQVWNTGQLRPWSPRARIDDVAFIRELLDDLARRVNIDPARIYVTGHSNGAGMTFRLGAELSQRFAALAPVASHCRQQQPAPAHALPTLYIIGTDDPLVPLAGGAVRLPWGNQQINPPVQETLQRWAAALGCPAEARELSNENGLRTIEYGPGRDGALLRAIFIEGHGHDWPGRRGLNLGVAEGVMGPNTSRLNATDVIWDFFQQHRRRDAGGAQP